MDSTGALKLEDMPPRLLVVGGGYIGLEMGYVYAALGSKVTVVELTDGLLPGVDRDLVLPLHKRLEKLFDKIYLKTKVAKLEETPKGIKADAGRRGSRRQGAGLRARAGRRSAAGPTAAISAWIRPASTIDEKGFIKVDEQRRTTAERIFAIGDVAGEPMLAHKATYEGKIAVEVITGEPAVYDARAMPAVVFTDPEVAWCGLTETEAKKQNREVKGRAFPVGRLRSGHDAGPHRGTDEVDRRSGDASACWVSASSAWGPAR